MDNPGEQLEFLIMPDEMAFSQPLTVIEEPFTPKIMQELETIFHIKPEAPNGSVLLVDESNRLVNKTRFGEDLYISVDSKGNIVAVSNFYGRNPERKGFTPITTDLETFIQNLITYMAEKFEGYELVKNRYTFGNDYRELSWMKRYPNGLYNSYEGVNILVDVRRQTVSDYASFDCKPTAETPEITPEQVEEMIRSHAQDKAFMEKLGGMDGELVQDFDKIQDLKLEYHMPYDAWGKVPKGPDDCVYLTYTATVCNGRGFVCIDAVSGKVIDVYGMK